jgi:hypothetical protein
MANEYLTANGREPIDWRLPESAKEFDSPQL